MDKSQAKNLIRNTFGNSFNRESFLIFAKNLFHFLDTDTFIYRGNLIPDAYDAHIKTLERARTLQRNFKKIPENEQKPFIEIADKILAITDSSDYSTSPEKQAKVTDYEKQIDQLVYKLCGLTPEEIKVVEGQTV